MFFYIIRHGDPDYEKDSLTELGFRQAQLTAERLAVSGVSRVFSSPLGRAQVTASFLAERLHLPVTVLDWARELGPDCRTPFPDGVLKGTGILPSCHLHQKQVLSMEEQTFFTTVPGICDNALYERFLEISAGTDRLLEENGYRRTEEGFYEPVSPNENHIALFCHGAMIRSILSHLLHLPYQCIGSSFHENPCGITVFRFRPGGTEPLVPELISFGDTGHLYADGKPQRFYLTGEEY